MCLAAPGRIVQLLEEDAAGLRRAVVDFAGVRREVSLAFTPEARPGDYVLVHVGFALSVVDEAEAQKIFRYLEEMAEAEEPAPEDSP